MAPFKLYICLALDFSSPCTDDAIITLHQLQHRNMHMGLNKLILLGWEMTTNQLSRVKSMWSVTPDLRRSSQIFRPLGPRYQSKIWNSLETDRNQTDISGI